MKHSDPVKAVEEKVKRDIESYVQKVFTPRKAEKRSTVCDLEVDENTLTTTTIKALISWVYYLPYNILT